jgi:hypothetical protein
MKRRITIFEVLNKNIKYKKMKKKLICGFAALAIGAVATLVFPLLISSCSTSEKQDVPVVSISPVDSISVFIGLPFFAEYYDNKLFVMDIHGEDGFLKVIDVKGDSLLYSFARRGNGPNEYLHVSSLNVNADDTNGTTIGVCDPASRKYRLYSYKSLCEQGAKTLPFSTLKFPDGARYTELKSLSQGFITSDLNGKGRFALLDDSLKNERYVCKYRPKPQESIPDKLHAMAHNGKIVVSPDRKTIANVIYIAEVFSVFQVKDNEVLPAWDYIVKEMDYHIENGNNIVTNTPIGYLSAAFDDKYIYGLFCGKPASNDAIAIYTDEIHVFSYNGKLVKKLILKTPAFGITIDSERRNLYVVVHDPEPKIFKYCLPE